MFYSQHYLPLPYTFLRFQGKSTIGTYSRYIASSHAKHDVTADRSVISFVTIWYCVKTAKRIVKSFFTHDM